MERHVERHVLPDISAALTSVDDGTEPGKPLPSASRHPQPPVVGKQFVRSWYWSFSSFFSIHMTPLSTSRTYLHMGPQCLAG